MNDSSIPSISSLKEELIRSMKREGVLKSSQVEEAVRSVPREEFLWPRTPKFTAYFDDPQPLGSTGQTISAPHMIVLMLEQLELSSSMKVLEVGAGSGYSAALIGHIVRRHDIKSKELPVISIERDHELAEFARSNLRKVGADDVVQVVEGDGSLGYPQQSEEEIYDRIVVAAGAPRVPIYLRKQLKVGGIMEIPLGGTSYQKLTKIRKEVGKSGRPEFETKEIVECTFVPLVGEDAHS